jgi:hypothetical protein
MVCSRCNYQNLVSSLERRCTERQRKSMETIPDIVIVTLFFCRSSWSWSYARWIYIYLCNQCLSPPNQVMSSNPVHGEVYSIQHYVIKFVSVLRQVDCILQVLWFPPPRNIPQNIIMMKYWNGFTNVTRNISISLINRPRLNLLIIGTSFERIYLL